MLSLGVLDQSPVRSGGNVADALHETLDLAELCDRLGYRRYWLAEHHSTKGLAGSSPEVLIGQVAARTSRIRVGSGGVMLQQTWQAFHLTAIDGLSGADAAERIPMAVAQVFVAKRRVQKAIQEELARLEGPKEDAR